MNKRLNILIVDDNKELAVNIMDILKNNNYSSVVSFDGGSALELVSSNDFQLGLIDMKLPDMTGIELIKKIIDIKPDMEFIIITGHGSLENATVAVSIKNILGFEIKPVDIEGLLSMINQVSQRRMLEVSLKESEYRYKILVENSMTAINIAVDKKIRFCNKMMLQLFGYKDYDDLIGMDISKLIHPDDIGIVNNNIDIRIKEELKEVRYECRGIKQDGSIIEIEVLGSIIMFEGKKATHTAILDISKRKRAEKGIKESQKNLEQKIMERTEELAKKNEDLQNFNRLFIGREKRIKELKEKLKEYQTEESDKG